MKREFQVPFSLFKKTYLPPDCKVFHMKAEQFICTSAFPKPAETEEPDFDPDEDVEGGEDYFE